MSGSIAVRSRARLALALLVSVVLVMAGGALVPAYAAATTLTIRGSIVVPKGVSPADYLDGVSLEWRNAAWKVGADNAYGRATLDERTGAFSITGVDAGSYTIRLAGSTTVKGITVDWDGTPGPVEPRSGGATGGGGYGWGVDTPNTWVTVSGADATAEPLIAPAFGAVTGKLILTDALPRGEETVLFLEATEIGGMPWDIWRTTAPVRPGVLSQTWRRAVDAGTFDVDAVARAYVDGTYKVWRYVGSKRVTVPAFGTATMDVVEQRPKITGTAKVGQRLRASTGTWPAGSKPTFQWLRGGKAIAGAKGSTYTITAADAGAKLSVRVSGPSSAWGPVPTIRRTSATVTVAKATLAASTPRITGTAKVGRTVKVVAGKWTSGTKLTYQWRANGVALKGATKSSYKLPASVRGKRITVTVTGTKSGYVTKKMTSRSTSKVAR
ncbi:hypothetical protein [Microbacterium dauci]|uniref:Carboxypeptidase regulatory-like domain-containing protein n=1 Tax=Microbacterium dauci TaxID=3048008 RepID=A0ABT6ZD03_9MICO|nr:hypothetical protein [Microbacterium sp. LX3-4]MDJ1114036.1 hypothetical protein [Microbacterium sp. LX3-4]